MLGDHYICSSVLVLYVATFLHHTALFTLDVEPQHVSSVNDAPGQNIFALFRFARSNEKKKKKQRKKFDKKAVQARGSSAA